MLRQSMTYWKLHRFPILMVLVCILLYFTISHSLERTDFFRLISLFAALFFLCYKLIQFEKWNFKFLLVAGILFRLVFLLAIPNLSQDFYRFIWDGHLLAQGMNPYLQVPDELIAQAGFHIPNAGTLHDGMGALSAKHYSNYPPVNQLIFTLAAWLGGKGITGSVLVLRMVIIFADIGIFYFGRRLLKLLNRSPHLIFWYFLNPLVIVELTGNLHAEGIMLFFFLYALFLLSSGRWIIAALPYALSIAVKLIPLIFIPLFIKAMGWKRGLLFIGMTLGISALCFLPFYDALLFPNYAATLKLWFSNFEFNAGIYNAIKKIALQAGARPWELIKTYGKITPFIITAILLLISAFRRNNHLGVLLSSMLWILCIYYFLAAIVHPWYLISLVLLTLFTDFRFPLLWSALVIVSYSAYSHPDYRENLGWLFFEYFLVFGFMLYEIFRYKSQKLVIHKN